MSIPDHAGTDAAQNATNDSAALGPQTELPEAAPEFVSDIKETIAGFIGDGSDILGELVSEIASSADMAQAVGFLTETTTLIPA